jgi:hyperosmotically inducible periplasmic protein
MEKHNNLKLSLFITALTLGSASTQLLALDNTMEEGNQSAYSKEFNALDTNSDGMLNKSEVKGEKTFTKNFSAADKNTDGTLSQEEFTNYKSQVDQKNMKRVGSDSMITSKIKGELLKDEGLKSLKVHVKTYQGIVQLNGFVDTEDQIQLAEKVASGVEGVKSVKNSLMVKKE